MKNKAIKKSPIVVLVIALIFLAMTTVSSFAATADVTIKADPMTVGETTTVTVTYSGSNIGRVSGNLTYDKDVVSYISGGNSQGDNGLVSLSRAGTGGDIVFTLKFEGKSAGDADFNLETLEVYDLDEQSMTFNSAHASINVENATVAENTDSDSDGTDQNTDSNTTKKSKTKDKSESNTTLYIVLGLAALVLIIIIVIIIVRKKRKKKRMAK